MDYKTILFDLREAWPHLTQNQRLDALPIRSTWNHRRSCTTRCCTMP